MNAPTRIFSAGCIVSHKCNNTSKFYVFPLTNPEKQNPAYEIKTRRNNQRPRDMEISEEELEKLVEKKVEERIKQREKTEDSSTREKDEKVNRRQFLKMAGLGAGAIGLTSAASALNFSPLGGGGSTQTLSGVLSEGNDVNGQNIVDGGTTIWDSNNNEIPATTIDQTSIDHSNLTNVNSGDHHSRYSDSEAQSAVEVSNISPANSNLNMGSYSLTTTNFEITENSSTKSLDFNYTG
jgi:hypothetical protein